MSETSQQLLQHLVTGVLAVILVGGSVTGWLLGRQVPEWLIGFDGVIVTAAFASGAFFGQARSTQQALASLAESRANHHELAMAQITGATATTVTGPPTNGEKEQA